MTQLPSRPDFEAMEAAAPASADRRTLVLALIGNLVFSWSNNESLFIYMLMVLLRTDQTSAAIIFATLNTSRARLDLIQRLARVNIKDRAVMKALDKLIDRFNDTTRVRNEFNHCLYSMSPDGEITHTQSLRIVQSRKHFQLSETLAMDDARMQAMAESVNDMRVLNRDLWAFLPQLEAHLDTLVAPARGRATPVRTGVPDSPAQ